MSKGFSAVYILVGILVFVGIAGGAYFLGMSKNSDSVPQPSPTVSSQPTPTSVPVEVAVEEPEEISNWKTYKNLTMTFELKHPNGEIIEDSIPIPNNGLQTTIKLNNENIVILKRPNINPTTNVPYKTLSEFDSRTINFSSIILDGLDAKDSGKYTTQAGTIQRDIMLIRKADIWIIQEVRLDQNVTIPFDQILSTFRFLN